MPGGGRVRSATVFALTLAALAARVGDLKSGLARTRIWAVSGLSSLGLFCRSSSLGASKMDENRVQVTEVAKHVWVVALLGEHDLSTADEVAAVISGVFHAGSNLVLDLSGASFIDSTVAAAVMRAQDRVDTHDQDELVVVAPIDSPARRTLDLVGIGEAVRVCESRAAAMEVLTYR
jgi:anti-anti-sigma factor